MVSLRRAAGRSLKAFESGENEKRFEEIARINNPVKRVGLIAVHNLVAKHPRLTSAALRSDPNVPYLTEGYRSEVYRVSDDLVMKIYKDSLGMSRREQKRLADQMREEHRALSEYVGPAVLPHVVDIGRHPAKKHLRS